MPSTLTPTHGMITFHPRSDEYTDQIKHWFLHNVEFDNLFESYAIIEEKKSHLHIPFRVAYGHVGSHRDRFTKKITDCIPGDYLNKKVAVKISWPKKQAETFVVLLGYCLKGIVQVIQDTNILKIKNISDEDIELAEQSAKDNTDIEITILNLAQIIKICKRYFADINYPYKTLRGFTTYIARQGGYYTVRDATIESIFEQTKNIHAELGLNSFDMLNLNINNSGIIRNDLVYSQVLEESDVE